MKDHLIDEERARQEEAAQENIEQKIGRLGNHILNLLICVNNALFLERYLVGNYFDKIC